MQFKEEKDIKRQVSIGLPLYIVAKIDKLRGPRLRSEYLREFIIREISKKDEPINV